MHNLTESERYSRLIRDRWVQKNNYHFEDDLISWIKEPSDNPFAEDEETRKANYEIDSELGLDYCFDSSIPIRDYDSMPRDIEKIKRRQDTLDYPHSITDLYLASQPPLEVQLYCFNHLFYCSPPQDKQLRLFEGKEDRF